MLPKVIEKLLYWDLLESTHKKCWMGLFLIKNVWIWFLNWRLSHENFKILWKSFNLDFPRSERQNHSDLEYNGTWWSSSEYRSFKIHLLCFQLSFSYQTSLGFDFVGFHHYATLTLSPLKVKTSKFKGTFFKWRAD